MFYKFLWNVRLWLTGIVILFMAPFVVLWTILVHGPIDLAKKFESERDN